MPLYVTGVTKEESPFSFGTASPAVKFKWTVSNDKVASLNNFYSSVSFFFNYLVFNFTKLKRSFSCLQG